MKNIPGYDGYAITEDGQVWSYKRNRFLTIRLDKDGYQVLTLRVDKKIKIGKVHRLVLLAFIGPDNDPNKTKVDHIDNIKTNNDINNLRWVTNSENNQNVKTYKGYSWNKQQNKWHAQIMVNKKNTYLGYYPTEDEARQAYLTAKKIYHPSAPDME
jgi:hypothetical protein